MKRYQRSHPDTALTIDSDEFFRDKLGALIRTARHFGQKIEDEELNQLKAGKITRRHSKRRLRRYDDSKRQRQEDEFRSSHTAEIAEAESWLNNL